MSAHAGLQNSVYVRDLTESDLGLLHEWLNAPHLKPFYMQRPVSRDEVNRKFRPRINGKDDCYCLIATLADTPFGYIQWYLNRSVPEYGVGTIGETDGVSFDYFIGDVEYLGKKLGSHILMSAIDSIVGTLEIRDRVFFVGHEPENKAAINCSKRAGFARKEQSDFVENGKCYHLYARELRNGRVKNPSSL